MTTSVPEMCNKITPGCSQCHEDKNTRNRFTGKFIMRCSECETTGGYISSPKQTSSGSECLKGCPPGQALKSEKCQSCGAIVKLKYKATCAKKMADDVCLTRAASNPEDIDKLASGSRGIQVMVKPCIRKKLDMPKNDLRKSADQMWLKRKYVYEPPPDPKKKGMQTQKKLKMYTLTVPVDWLLKAKIVKPSADWVPSDQEYCLTARVDGKTGKASSELTVQPCEYTKTQSKIRDVQLFDIQSIACADNSGTGGFRAMEFMSLMRDKRLVTASPNDYKALLGSKNHSDINRWTSFEEQMLSDC